MNVVTRSARNALLAALLALTLVTGTALAQDFTVNLKETDIQELIKFVAEATGTTIVVDPSVKGKVKVVSSKPVSREELYELFLSILEVHGYTAVRSGGVIRVIQNKDARSAPVQVRDGNTGKASDEYVTEVIKLDNISAAKLIPVLRPLVPQQAHMAAYAPSNAIIISDLSSNIDRIRNIIERMDKSAVQQTDIVKLRYGVAENVVSMLDQLAKSEAKQSGGESEVLLVADARTNSVLVSGDELERARIRTLVEYLDTPLEQSGNVKVVYLEYANATDIADVLTRVMQNINRLDTTEGAKKPRSDNSATIEADEGTNSLIITADTDEMAAIEGGYPASRYPPRPGAGGGDYRRDGGDQRAGPGHPVAVCRQQRRLRQQYQRQRRTRAQYRRCHPAGGRYRGRHQPGWPRGGVGQHRWHHPWLGPDQ